MTQPIARSFPAARVAILPLILAVFLASGCQSTATSETPAVVSALEVTVEDPDSPDASTTQATSRDGYPSFAGSLNAANVQMSNEEAQSLQAELTALGTARASGALTEAEYQRRLAALRKLADQHGQETLSQIEN